MRSHKLKSKAAVGAAAALALAACGGGGSGAEGSGSGSGDEPIRVRYVTGQPESPSYSQTVAWWAEEVEKRSDGAVEIELFFNGSLVASEDTLGALSSGGTAELGFVTPAYAPTEFPLWNISSVVFTTDNAEARMNAFYDQYENNDLFRAEFEAQGIEVLAFDPIGPAALAATEPVTGLADLKGLRLRAVGLISEALEEVGARPAAVAAEEIYESVERGTLDGITAAPFDSLDGFGMDEVAPHITATGAGTYISTAIGANKEWWDSLPEDVQSVMLEVSEELKTYSVELLMELETAACELIAEADGSVQVFSDADTQAWEDAAGARVQDKWLADATASGLSEEDAQAFLQEHLDLIAEREAESSYTNGMAKCAEDQG